MAGKGFETGLIGTVVYGRLALRNLAPARRNAAFPYAAFFKGPRPLRGPSGSRDQGIIVHGQRAAAVIIEEGVERLQLHMRGNGRPTAVQDWAGRRCGAAERSRAYLLQVELL